MAMVMAQDNRQRLKVLFLGSLVFGKNLLSVLESSAGRDKIYRGAAFGAKILVSLIEPVSPKSAWITPLNKLAKMLGDGRRLFRLLKYFSSLQTILEKTLYLEDPFLRVFSTLKTLSQLIFLYHDQNYFLAQIKLINSDAERKKYLASCGWCMSIAFALVCDLYDLSVILIHIERLTTRKEKLKQSGPHEDKDLINTEARNIQLRMTNLRAKLRVSLLNLTKNAFDIFIAIEAVFAWGKIPSNALNYFGLISSIVSTYLLWPVPKSTSSLSALPSVSSSSSSLPGQDKSFSMAGPSLPRDVSTPMF